MYRFWISTLGEICSFCMAVPIQAQLSLDEIRMTETVGTEFEQTVSLLERLTNQNSGTRNIEGNRIVDEMLRPEFEALGFSVQWIGQDSVALTGHLFARHEGTPDGNGDDSLARGSFTSLSIALAHIAEIMDPAEDVVDPAEDVVILYATSHGLPAGIVYHYGDQGYGSMSPLRLSTLFGELRITNRLLIINACFSGTFVRGLSSPSSVVISSAAADRTSFGCAATNDWTYFGDAFVNRALRQPQSLAEAFGQARVKISQWEADIATTSSEPQIGIEPQANIWLTALENHVPQAVAAPVGRPAADGAQ